MSSVSWMRWLVLATGLVGHRAAAQGAEPARPPDALFSLRWHPSRMAR